MFAVTLRRQLSSFGHDTLHARVSTPGPAQPGSGSDTLFRARYGCYLHLGFDREQAFFLAMTPEVGIVDALRLVENGCPHATAVEILSA